MKNQQLGIDYGTASSRLKKMILWSFIEKLKLTNCYRCNLSMSLETYSVDHKNPWLHVDNNLFWDLNNISFSHLSCNTKNRRIPKIQHGRTRYKKGCRCAICKYAHARYRYLWRKRTGKR